MSRSRGAKAAYDKAYRAANRERRAEQFRKYRAANRERLLAQGREYRATHREQIVAKRSESRAAAKRKEYRATHREQIKTERRDYYVANLEKVAAWGRRYRDANRERLAAQRVTRDTANLECKELRRQARYGEIHPATNCVYLIRTKSGLTMGRAKVMGRRLAAYRTHAPDAEVLSTFPGQHVEELDAHRHFSGSRLSSSREWYTDTAEVAARMLAYFAARQLQERRAA